MVYLHSTCPGSCTQCWQSHSEESPCHRLPCTENRNWRNHLGQNRIGSREEDLLDYTSSLEKKNTETTERPITYTLHIQNSMIAHVKLGEQWEQIVQDSDCISCSFILQHFSHLSSYLGKQEVHDSSCLVKSISSRLCQSDQNPPHTEWCILSHSCTLLEGPGIAWRHWGEPLGCRTAPLEKKHIYSSEQCTILCILRKFVLFSETPGINSVTYLYM